MTRAGDQQQMNTITPGQTHFRTFEPNHFLENIGLTRTGYVDIYFLLVVIKFEAMCIIFSPLTNLVQDEFSVTRRLLPEFPGRVRPAAEPPLARVAGVGGAAGVH